MRIGCDPIEGVRFPTSHNHIKEKIMAINKKEHEEEPIFTVCEYARFIKPPYISEKEKLERIKNAEEKYLNDYSIILDL